MIELAEADTIPNETPGFDWTIHVAKLVVEGGTPEERQRAIAAIDHELALFMAWLEEQPGHVQASLEVETISPAQVRERVRRATECVPAKVE